ncbi:MULTISPECIES: Sec-independent protein translocase protein TatB [unclassified Psychrobacter]|uniref:Sec-independent protein translocase protein TatB n=1 Tax=unclassified Psychrobacter TaxID=196806 RepID=UPI0018F6E42F|nr:MULTISPECIES: Sec-independent protein translocase protein TatB [unclassified Psychrobacter]
MFDIGFSELLLFGVIALIVLGPEKLPQAARTAGQWYAKIRRTVTTLQSEIEAELDLAETRKQMQDELAKIRQTEAQMQQEIAAMRSNMQELKQSAHTTTGATTANQSTSQANTAAAAADINTAIDDDTSADDLAKDNTVVDVPIMTRPWENMWFYLGAYDKARRLPPAPRMPNYQADTLLYTHQQPAASTTPQEAS